jgi:hypothetical protein
MPDDWGAHGNKAKTQHEPAMDIFKGAIDTYATKFSILLSSMGTPNSLTEQLTEKYTHELYIPDRSIAKYDICSWQQNFGGWTPRTGKEWLHSFKFEEVPTDIYKRYDEHRTALVDMLNQQIKDTMVDTEAFRAIRLMHDEDLALLDIIRQQGALSWDWFQRPENEKFKDALKRATSRSIVTSMPKIGTKHTYVYDMTDYGAEVYRTIQKLNGTSTNDNPALKSAIIDKGLKLTPLG